MAEASAAQMRRAASDQDVVIDPEMSSEQLLDAGKKLKKQLSRANEKNQKLEQRFVNKVKEWKQANKLIEENEKSITELENEIGTARNCLNKVFVDLPRAFIFDSDNKLSIEVCNEMYLSLRSVEKERIEQVKQQAYSHAMLNNQNAVQSH